MLVGSSQSQLSVSDFRKDIFGPYDDEIVFFLRLSFNLRVRNQRHERERYQTCLWRIDTAAVKRSEPRNAQQLRTQTPDDFLRDLCRGRPDTAASANL